MDARRFGMLWVWISKEMLYLSSSLLLIELVILISDSDLLRDRISGLTAEWTDLAIILDLGCGSLMQIRTAALWLFDINVVRSSCDFVVTFFTIPYTRGDPAKPLRTARRASPFLLHDSIYSSVSLTNRCSKFYAQALDRSATSFLSANQFWLTPWALLVLPLL